jgi:hypothetical protein
LDLEASKPKLDFIDANNLVRVIMDKRSYGSHLNSESVVILKENLRETPSAAANLTERMLSKGYAKDVKSYLRGSTSETEAFEKGLLAYHKEHIFPKFDEFEFYCCPSNEVGGL